MYKYTCEDDLCDSVHLAMVIARKWRWRCVLAALCLQITQYETVVSFESNSIRLPVTSWKKKMKLTNQITVLRHVLV